MIYQFIKMNLPFSINVKYGMEEMQETGIYKFAKGNIFIGYTKETVGNHINLYTNAFLNI